MGREQQTLDPARRVAGRRGLVGKDIGRGAETPASTWRRNSGKSTTPARLISRTTEPGAIRSNSRFRQEPLVLAGHAGEHDDDLARRQDLVKRRGATPKPAMKCSEIHGS